MSKQSGLNSVPGLAEFRQGLFFLCSHNCGFLKREFEIPPPLQGSVDDR